MVRAQVCEAFGCGFKSRRPPQNLRSSLENKKGGEVMEKVDRAYQILMGVDRLQDNPDTEFLRATIAQQLSSEGILRFFVFVCPKFNPSALFSERPEEYMPVVALQNDLFQQRILKIQKLQQELDRIGVVAEINLVIGDNDAEAYVLPFVQVRADLEKFRLRQQIYEKSFRARAERQFMCNCVVWSLGCLSVNPDNACPIISEGEMSKELVFFSWLFSEDGPYKGKLTFTKEQLQKMVELKFRLYGSQGKFLEQLGGILLQTEGPGVWLQRTKMLRCTGSAAVPAIYPWIRKEEQI